MPDGIRVGDAVVHLCNFIRFTPENTASWRGCISIRTCMMPASLLQFAELCQQLAATTRKLEKRSLMADYLRPLPVDEAGLAALYLAGIPFSETDLRALQVGGALLTRVIRRISGAGEPAIHASYLRHGDLGGAAGELFVVRSIAPTLQLTDVAEAFAAIAAATKPAAREQVVFTLLDRATPLEARYLIKIILGDMRTGIQVSLVEEAIAAAYLAPVAEVRRARMLNGDLPEVLGMAAAGRLAEARMKLFHPLGFMLASPVETVEEALQRFSREVAAETGEAPPDPATQIIKEAQLEDKYDGVRAQIHCGSSEHPGRVAIFSRSREDMTASFPEIVEAFAGVEEPLVLDGEILAWNAGSGDVAARALPFASLQGRLGRKRVTADMRVATPVVFMAFDVLYRSGEMVMEQTLIERRQALEDVVTQHQARTLVGSSSAVAQNGQIGLAFAPEPTTDGFARMVLSPAVQLQSVEQLEQAYVDARARGNEGVMLKARHSTYQPGRRGLAWLKLKRELATLDVVVTAAEYGHGRRAGWLSDYTFAVRDGEKLLNVGKAYSGVTDAEVTQLTQFFLEHTLEDFGGIRSVEPLVVFEVAFNNVMRSERHESGFALRFPRILRIRDDKPVSEIDTLERVAEIYQLQPDKPTER